MVNWVSTKVTEITREKKVALLESWANHFGKKLFHKWEYEKKDKEERATSATSTLRLSDKCPQNPF